MNQQIDLPSSLEDDIADMHLDGNSPRSISNELELEEDVVIQTLLKLFNADAVYTVQSEDKIFTMKFNVRTFNSTIIGEEYVH